jgi:hypothetical protein
MSHAKQVSKRKRRTKAVTALGVAGLLSLTGGASAENVDLAKDTSTENAAAHHGITLEEEEISDVSLGTFYLFDKEDAGTHHPGIQLARGCRGCGGGCRGCRGCARGCRGCRGCGGCGLRRLRRLVFFGWRCRRLRFLISAGEARRIAPNIAKLPDLLGKTVP